MPERYIYNIDDVPVSAFDLDHAKDMPYEFGWASVYETHVSFRTPSGYVYQVSDRIDY
jgi:hypothetical protein